MEIANIYPIKNQQFYVNEKFVMILAHLVKKNLYMPDFFTEDQYIIMDNGLYEEEQVSTDLEPIIQLAKNSGIPVKEIIVPDVVNNLEETIKLFEENLECIKKHSEYNFMFVAQSNNAEELSRAIDYINKYVDTIPNITVGVSKLSPMDRGSKEVADVLKKCSYPIHYLGIKTTFKELENVADIIRSCDTSQLAYIAKNENKVDSIWCYERKGRRADGRGVEGVDIDLENDSLDDSKLLKFYKEFYGCMSFDEYQKYVKKGASNNYTKQLSIIGLVGEIGELADVVKKETIYEDMSKFEQKYGMSVEDKIVDEAGDVLWQFVNVLNQYDVSIEEVINANVAKLMKRHGNQKVAKDGGKVR